MKYSVIIPIYNAERTLRRCLDSLLPQLNPDIEVVLINDGSSDNSERLCKEYLNKSNFIKYYSQENRGVSSARNNGLGKATGDYILFVDSDDYVSDNYFDTIRCFIQNSEPDILLFGARFLNRSDISVVNYGDEKFYTNKRIAKQFFLLYKQNNLYTLWNKVFNKHIIDDNNLRFDSDLHIGEDAVFIFHYFLYVKSVVSCENIIYFVDESNQNSLSRKRRENLSFELISATKHMEKYLEKSAQDINSAKIFKRCIAWGHYRGAYACFNEIFNKCSKDEINDEIIKICELYRLSRVKPVGLSTTIISLPVILKLLPVLKLIFYIKMR